MPIRFDTERVSDYFILMSAKFPWITHYYWSGHITPRDIKNSMIFYPSRSIHIKSVEKEPIIIQLTSARYKQTLAANNQLDGVSRIPKGTIQFMFDDTQIATYIRETNTFVFTDLTHTLDKEGIAVLTEIFQKFEEINKEKHFVELPVDLNVIEYIGSPQFYLFDGTCLKRIAINIVTEERIENFEDAITAVIDAEVRRNLQKLSNKINDILYYLQEEISGDEMKIFAAREWIEKGYPVFFKPNLEKSFLLLYPFYYEPKEIYYDGRYYKLPKELPEADFNRVFFGFIAPQITQEGNKYKIVNVRILRKNLDYVTNRSHIDSDGKLCLGDLRFPREFEEIPKEGSFFDTVITRIWNAMTIINLDSAFSCRETRYYKDILRELQTQMNGEVTVNDEIEI